MTGRLTWLSLTPKWKREDRLPLTRLVRRRGVVEQTRLDESWGDALVLLLLHHVSISGHHAALKFKVRLSGRVSCTLSFV